MKKCLVMGTFDLFHEGHLNLVNKSNDYCDQVILGVKPDKFIQENDSKTSFWNEDKRLDFANSIEGVDKAIKLNGDYDSMLSYIRENNIDGVIVGNDHIDNIKYIKLSEELEVKFIEYTDGVSSSKIREEINKES